MNCPKCNKPIKENTDGNNRYCQGHSVFEEPKPKTKTFVAEYRIEVQAKDKEEAWGKIEKILEETIFFNEDRGLDLLIGEFAINEGR